MVSCWATRSVIVIPYDGIPERVFKQIDQTVHYAETGIQVMPINTLFQLYSMKQNDDVQLRVADKLLFMPDLFSYFLPE